MLGAARIAGLIVPQRASTRATSAKTAIVARSEVAPRRTPAASGPNGEMRSEIDRNDESTRPIRRSGVMAIRYPCTIESVEGITNAVGRSEAART